MKKIKKYTQAGVNIDEGDAASSLAGKWSATTFAGRKGKIGEPVKLLGGFAGALNFGKHLIIACDDGTGTKMEVAERMNNFETIGADLLAMVSDDAVCLGAEVVSITNTIDTPKVDRKVIGELLKSLAHYCREQKVVIAGGEIAEVGSAAKRLIWNASAIGVVEKKKIIDGGKVRPGDLIIALKENGLRSNGFSLARKILSDNFGLAWHTAKYQGRTWGELLLTPSKIYHAAVLELIGRFEKKRKIDVHGIVHVTGGGVPGNLPRVFHNKKLGAKLTNLWAPPAWVEELIRLGKVTLQEAREVWNLGNGMLIVVAKKDAEKTIEALNKNKIAAKVAGVITSTGKIEYS